MAKGIGLVDCGDDVLGDKVFSLVFGTRMVGLWYRVSQVGGGELGRATAWESPGMDRGVGVSNMIP